MQKKALVIIDIQKEPLIGLLSTKFLWFQINQGFELN